MIVVWVSCGAASAVAAIETQRLFGEVQEIRYVNSPIKEEDPDNLRFIDDLSRHLGAPIERAVNAKFPNGSAREVWAKRRAMSAGFWDRPDGRTSRRDGTQKPRKPKPAGS